MGEMTEAEGGDEPQFPMVGEGEHVVCNHGLFHFKWNALYQLTRRMSVGYEIGHRSWFTYYSSGE